MTNPRPFSDHTILEALENQPFSSIQELEKLTYIPNAPVFQHLKESLGFMVKHFQRLPHSLIAPQKIDPVTRSEKPLHQLLSIKHHGWQFILTLDESWFYFASDHGHIWLHPEAQPPERPRHTIQDPK